MKRKEYHAETETGLHNFRARMYLSYEMLTGWKAQPIPHWQSSFHRDDSFSKRFNSVDPLHEFASPFCYVGNNPVSFVDSNGKVSTIVVVGSQMAAAGAIYYLGVVGLALSGPVGWVCLAVAFGGSATIIGLDLATWYVAHGGKL